MCTKTYKAGNLFRGLVARMVEHSSRTQPPRASSHSLTRRSFAFSIAAKV